MTARAWPAPSFTGPPPPSRTRNPGGQKEANEFYASTPEAVAIAVDVVRVLGWVDAQEWLDRHGPYVTSVPAARAAADALLAGAAS